MEIPPFVNAKGLISALTVGLLCLGLAACGGGDTPSSEQAAERAREIAENTHELSSDPLDAGRALVEDPDARDDAVDRLRDVEDQARDLAGDAEDLPESTDARSRLREDNERIAEAAGDLADADQGAGDEALEEALGKDRGGQRQHRRGR